MLSEFGALRHATDTDGDLDGTISGSPYLWRRVCCERSLSDHEASCYRILYRPQNGDEGNGDCLHICGVLPPDQWNALVERYLDSLTEEELERLLNDEDGAP